MNTMHVTIHDFENEDAPVRYTAEVSYDPMASIAQQGDLKVTISVGGDVVSGMVALPLNMLMMALNNAMAARAHKQNTGLVGIKPPKVILPN